MIICLESESGIIELVFICSFCKYGSQVYGLAYTYTHIQWSLYGGTKIWRKQTAGRFELNRVQQRRLKSGRRLIGARIMKGRGHLARVLHQKKKKKILEEVSSEFSTVENN